MAENRDKCHDCNATVTRVIPNEENACDDYSEVEPNANGYATNTTSGPITEEEITAFLMQRARTTTPELVGIFKARIRCSEDKQAFAVILKRISKIRKTTSGTCYVILRNSSTSTFGEEDADGEVIDADGGVPPVTATKQKETTGNNYVILRKN